jgi:hypothetical protein
MHAEIDFGHRAPMKNHRQKKGPARFYPDGPYKALSFRPLLPLALSKAQG